MTKLEQLHLFLKFHFAPDSETKQMVWLSCSKDPYEECFVIETALALLDGDYKFNNFELQMLRTIAEPPSFATNDVELAMKLTRALTEYENDPEAAHVTADEFLVSLIESLGHPNVAEAYRGVNKWST